MNEMTMPTLYKLNSDGKTYQQWTIRVHIDEDGMVSITKEYGQVGGKLQISAPDYIGSKNIGKVNETTPYEQAVLEADAQWKKKQTGAKGYTPSMDDAAAGIRSDLNTGAAAPMLAKKYGLMLNDAFTPIDNTKVVFPCFGQPKLNGNRLIATIVDGVATLTSRECKSVETVPHIKAELERLFPDETVTFDGEMYNHEFHEHLEDLRHMIAHGDERVLYYVYDIINEHTFEERRTHIEYLFDTTEGSEIVRAVDTPVLNDHVEALSYFRFLRDNQFEGLILRNADGLYGSGKRSYDLQKLKGWIDREFLIVDVIEKGRGKDAGKAKFVCVTGAPAVEFKVDIAASAEVREQLWAERDGLIGKWLTVRFAYYTQDGKPFHAQGLEIREASEANTP